MVSITNFNTEVCHSRTETQYIVKMIAATKADKGQINIQYICRGPTYGQGLQSDKPLADRLSIVET